MTVKKVDIQEFLQRLRLSILATNRAPAPKHFGGTASQFPPMFLIDLARKTGFAAAVHSLRVRGPAQADPIVRL